MSNSVPLIRAAAAVPWVNWLNAHGRPVALRLEAADLGFLRVDEPNRVVPLLNVLEFMRQQSRIEGPDLACRVVSTASIVEMANLGLVALNARTPRESLVRVERVLPRHCTHEVIHVEQTPTGIRVRESWLCHLDQETLSLVQAYVVSLVASILRLTGASDPVFETLRMVPHPEAGFTHLTRWFGEGIEPSALPHVEMEIALRIADSGFEMDSARAAPQPPPGPEDWHRLRNTSLLSDGVLAVIQSMLGHGSVGIDRVAAACGMPVRTLQRQLSDEGTDFSTLLDEARKIRALAWLDEGSKSVGEVATGLGYANPPAFTRAFRRWTGLSPRDVERRRGGGSRDA